MPRLAIGLLATSAHKKYRDQIIACRQTWVAEAEPLGVPVLFFGGGHHHDEAPLVNLPGVLDDYSSASDKQYLGLKYLYENHPSDFYFFAGTDNYILIKRMLVLLESYDPNDLLYIGGHGWHRNINGKAIYFHSGGGGFILSHALMTSLDEKGILTREALRRWREICVGELSYLKDACDVGMAYFLATYVPEFKIVRDKRFYGCSCYGRNHNDSQPCCMYGNSPDWNSLVTLHYMEAPMIKDFHLYLSNEGAASMCDSRWTLVTCIVNIPKQQVKCLRFVLGLYVNLVVLCQPHLRDEVMALRKSYGLQDHTHIVSQFKRALSPSISTSSFSNFPLSNKLQAVYTAMDLAPFEKENVAVEHFYGWINCDIDFVTHPHSPQLYRALQQYREKCSFCILDENLTTSANFFTGSKSSFREISKFDTIQAAHKSDANLFHFYHSDDFAVLANYDHIRVNPSFLLNGFISGTRSKGAYSLCLEASSKLLDDVENDHCILGINDKVKLLSELFESAWALEQGKVVKRVLDTLDEMQSLPGFENALIALGNSSLIGPGRNSSQSFAVVTMNLKLSVKEILENPLIKDLSFHHAMVIYADVSLGYHSLCHHRIIIVPKSEASRFAVPDEKTRVTLTMK